MPKYPFASQLHELAALVFAAPNIRTDTEPSLDCYRRLIFTRYTQYGFIKFTLNDAAILTIMSELPPALSSVENPHPPLPSGFVPVILYSQFLQKQNPSVTLCVLTLYNKVCAILTTWFSILKLCVLCASRRVVCVSENKCDIFINTFL